MGGLKVRMILMMLILLLMFTAANYCLIFVLIIEKINLNTQV